MKTEAIAGMIWFIAVLLIVIVVTIFSCISAYYDKFIKNHSVSISRLKVINKEYKFNYIPEYVLRHSYDNEIFYNNISCKDYLTYNLVYDQSKISTCLKNTLDNKVKYEIYMSEVKSKCPMDVYDTDKLPKNQKRLLKRERKMFENTILKPTINFVAFIELILTNINGRYRDSKSCTFSAETIKDIINKLRQKDGYYYRNEEIWKSICRVERGKVTNRMRFAIYDRDHYRCRMCGRKTNDLEVDHIIPIAKGGKSTFDNLQTLCHRCNTKKGTNIY